MTNDLQTRRYTFKLYPTVAQLAALDRQAALLARLWNAALEQRETQWAHELGAKGNWHKVDRPKEDKPAGLTYYDQARQLKFIRADDPEYAAMSSASLELCLSALDLAFKAFWRRLKEGARGDAAGYPRYKRVADHGTIWHRDGAGWKLTGSDRKWRLRAKGVPGPIKARGEFPAAPVEYRTMEIIRREGQWWASIVVRMEPRRERVLEAPAAAIHFDLIDSFARIDIGVSGGPAAGSSERTIGLDLGQGSQPVAWSGAEWERAFPSMARKSAASAPRARDSASMDEIQSAGDRRFRKFSNRWRREKRRLAKMKAKQARQRREGLHCWTTEIVRSFGEIAVIAPPILESTATARGDESSHGAAVKPVAMLNRHVLEQAPAMAIQMLEYKSAEAGIPFVRTTPDEHALAIGRDLPAATKIARRAKRTKGQPHERVPDNNARPEGSGRSLQGRA